VLENKLDAIEAQLPKNHTPELEPLLRILFEALIESTHGINERPQRFMRLLGLAYTQSQEHLRQTIAHNYEDTYSRYVGLLNKTVSHLDPIEFYWRINFILGASIFTLSSFESIQAILSDEHSVDMQIDGAVKYLVTALAGMLANSNSGV